MCYVLTASIVHFMFVVWWSQDVCWIAVYYSDESWFLTLLFKVQLCKISLLSSPAAYNRKETDYLIISISWAISSLEKMIFFLSSVIWFFGWTLVFLLFLLLPLRNTIGILRKASSFSIQHNKLLLLMVMTWEIARPSIFCILADIRFCFFNFDSPKKNNNK